MSRSPIPVVVLAWLFLLAGSVAGRARVGSLVTAQGRLADAGPSLDHASPRGSLRLEVRPVEAGFHRVVSDVRVVPRSGEPRWVRGVPGDAFFASDVGRFVSVETSESARVGSRLRVRDLAGALVGERRVAGLVDPVLAPDGRWFGYRTADAVVVLDLRTLRERRHAALDGFVLGSRGRLAGWRSEGGTRVVVADRRGRELSFQVPGRVVRLALAAGEDALWLLEPEELRRLTLPGGDLRTVYRASPEVRLRDLRVASDHVVLGARGDLSGGGTSGERLVLDPSGALLARQPGAAAGGTSSEVSPLPLGKIPWPLEPQAQHPIGNTYGEFQDYGGGGYMHPGVDVMGDPGEPVYAVASGVVKAVLTTSGAFHWRVATGDLDTAGTSEGYLYAHLIEASIAVDPGDLVRRGQYLGDLVPWPNDDFTHVHMSRIQDAGLQWSGGWLCTENPHLRLFPQTEAEPPVFETALGGQLLAFSSNESSTYLSHLSLSGAVDVIAHVGDRANSPWVCSVQELRYRIHPLGDPANPVVPERLAVRFDMDLDTYTGGPIDPMLVGLLYREDGVLDTEGDYDDREFFHVLTNSDGDEVHEASDAAEAWDTTLVPNGDYVIEVTARDAAGNATTASMTVTVAN